MKKEISIDLKILFKIPHWTNFKNTLLFFAS
jgi:hypothetical protein